MIKTFIIAKTEYSIKITPHFIKLKYIFVKEQFRNPCQFLDRDSVMSYKTSDQNVLCRYKTRQNSLKSVILKVHIKTVLSYKFRKTMTLLRWQPLLHLILLVTIGQRPVQWTNKQNKRANWDRTSRRVLIKKQWSEWDSNPEPSARHRPGVDALTNWAVNRGPSNQQWKLLSLTTAHENYFSLLRKARPRAERPAK